MKLIRCNGDNCTKLIYAPDKFCDGCIAQMERDILTPTEPAQGETLGCLAIICNPVKDALQSVKKKTRLQHAAYKEFGEEKSRRESFIGKWPHPQRLQNAQAFAKYGFFYTGNGDLVRCHQCGIGLKDWSEDDNPLREHIRYSPDCQFLQNILVSNQRSRANMVIKLFRAVVYGNPQAQHLEYKAETGEQFALQRVKKDNAQYTASLSRTTLSLTAAYKAFTMVEVRLRSFYTGWPHLPQVLNVDLLAKFGFFFTGRGDLVRCFQCGLELKDWNEGDNPLLQHIRYSPDCLFLVESLSSDVLAHLKASRLPKHIDAKTDSVGSHHSAYADYAGGSTSHQPTNTEYTTITQRISSYTDWPNDVKQEPEALATAGFFYTGTGDSVRCFACNIILGKWYPEEDPWFEHARWRPTCPHILKIKGEAFVQSVKLVVDNRETQTERGRFALGTTEGITTKDPPFWETYENDLSALKEETTLLKRKMTCKLCKLDKVKILFLPCGHLWVCQKCAKDLEECPECHKPINAMVNVTFVPEQ